MNLGTIPKIPGARKGRKRLGRGEGSGHGGTSTRGHKGQKARSGGMRGRAGFEGGQMPFVRRLPKRGFHSFTRREFQVVNVGSLNSFPKGSVVDAKLLKEQGLLHQETGGLKILGEGEITIPLVVRANRFSESAQKKITAAGGKAELL